MRVRPLSDLHFEFHADHGKEFVAQQRPDGVDVLVLAGDIARMDAGIEASIARFRQRYDCPIVFVPGNHEYHRAGRRIVAADRERVRSNLRGVHWLDGDLVEIAGRRFLGTTLWYGRTKPPTHLEPRLRSTQEDWDNGIVHGVDVHGNGVLPYVYPDFSEIDGLSSWVYEESARAVRFLTENLREGDVVVTHFMPSQLSVAERFRGALSNCWFVHDVEPLIRERKPALWIHGHTHDSFDYRIGPTRVLCNPFGHLRSGEHNRLFDDHMIIEAR